MNNLQRTIEFAPAFDRRNPDPSKNYGIHGMEMRFLLKGPAGVVQFVLYTGWHLRRVQEELDRKPVDPRFPHLLCHPTPADLGYHSPTPKYDGQTSIQESCPYLDGRPCYYDGSGLNAEPVYWGFVEHGEEWLWAEMERYYAGCFSGAAL